MPMQATLFEIEEAVLQRCRDCPIGAHLQVVAFAQALSSRRDSACSPFPKHIFPPQEGDGHLRSARALLRHLPDPRTLATSHHPALTSSSHQASCSHQALTTSSGTTPQTSPGTQAAADVSTLPGPRKLILDAAGAPVSEDALRLLHWILQTRRRLRMGMDTPEGMARCASIRPFFHMAVTALGSMAAGSMAAGSMAAGSMEAGSMAAGSMAAGSMTGCAGLVTAATGMAGADAATAAAGEGERGAAAAGGGEGGGTIAAAEAMSGAAGARPKVGAGGGGGALVPAASTHVHPALPPECTHLLPDVTMDIEDEGSAAFQRARNAYGSIMAVHGTAGDSLHSILRCGLLNLAGTKHMRTGAVFGEGVYFSTDASVAFTFSKPSNTGADIWPHAAPFVGTSRYVFVAEIALDPSFVKYDSSSGGAGDAARSMSSGSASGAAVRVDSLRKGEDELPPTYLVVANSDLIRLRHLLVYAEPALPSGTFTRSMRNYTRADASTENVQDHTRDGTNIGGLLSNASNVRSDTGSSQVLLTASEVLTTGSCHDASHCTEGDFKLGNNNNNNVSRVFVPAADGVRAPADDSWADATCCHNPGTVTLSGRDAGSADATHHHLVNAGDVAASNGFHGCNPIGMPTGFTTAGLTRDQSTNHHVASTSGLHAVVTPSSGLNGMMTVSGGPAPTCPADPPLQPDGPGDTGAPGYGRRHAGRPRGHLAQQQGGLPSAAQQHATGGECQVDSTRQVSQLPGADGDIGISLCLRSNGYGAGLSNNAQRHGLHRDRGGLSDGSGSGSLSNGSLLVDTQLGISATDYTQPGTSGPYSTQWMAAGDAPAPAHHQGATAPALLVPDASGANTPVLTDGSMAGGSGMLTDGSQIAGGGCQKDPSVATAGFQGSSVSRGSVEEALTAEASHVPEPSMEGSGGPVTGMPCVGHQEQASLRQRKALPVAAEGANLSREPSEGAAASVGGGRADHQGGHAIPQVPGVAPMLPRGQGNAGYTIAQSVRVVPGTHRHEGFACSSIIVLYVLLLLVIGAMQSEMARRRGLLSIFLPAWQQACGLFRTAVAELWELFL
eukprot:jgi/Mesvir1/877/Mv17443-RA.1